MSHDREVAAAGPQEIRVVKLDPTLTLAELVERAELAKRNWETVLRTPPPPPPRATASDTQSRTAPPVP